MKKKLPTIVFFGSGPVAAASLRFLANYFPIEAVITKKRPEHHKDTAPVEEALKEHGFTSYFANNKIELDAVMRSHSFESRVGIVVDYGVIMSETTINSFPLGIINSHFSLLPEWRGADPITFSILSGQDKTGVSLMKIVQALDEGELISQDRLNIEPHITTPELTEQLITLSNRMLLRDIPKYAAGKLLPYPQKNESLSYSRKLKKEDGVVDWNKPAEVLEREIRAFIEWPKSLASLKGQEFIIKKADVTKETGKPGEFKRTKKELIVYCGKDALSINILQPRGKKEMPIDAFLAGYKL